MYPKSFSFTGLLATALSLFLLSSPATCTPLPDTVDLSTRAAPGCPSVKVLPNANKLFYGTLTRPEIATFEGGYYSFVSDYYSSNFTITDNTVNYPTYIKGKKRDVLGTWAKTGKAFAKGLTENLPKIREVFDIQVDGGLDTSFGSGAKCRESTTKGTFIAKLKKDFS